MSIVGYNIMGGFTLVACVLAALFCVFALLEEKVNALARRLHVACAVLMLLNIAYVVIGFVAPDDSVLGIYVFSTILMYLAVIAIPLVGKFAIDFFLTTSLRLSGVGSVTKYYESKGFGFLTMNVVRVMLALDVTVLVISCIAVCVYSARGDFAMASIFYRINAGIASVSTIFAVLWFVNVLDVFIKDIEKTTHNVEKITGGTPGSEEQRTKKQIQVLTKRLKLGKMMSFGVIPMGLIVGILHVIVIPMTWYMGLLHILNMVQGILVMMIILLPQKSREKLRKTFLPCFTAAPAAVIVASNPEKQTTENGSTGGKHSSKNQENHALAVTLSTSHE